MDYLKCLMWWVHIGKFFQIIEVGLSVHPLGWIHVVPFYGALVVTEVEGVEPLRDQLSSYKIEEMAVYRELTTRYLKRIKTLIQIIISQIEERGGSIFILIFNCTSELYPSMPPA